MKEKKIAREERNQEKLANGDWVMAEFYATWCPHCQRMKPVVEEFKKLMEGTLEVVLVDIDQEPALTDFYTVESTPTFILFRKGQQLETIRRITFGKIGKSSERIQILTIIA